MRHQRDFRSYLAGILTALLVVGMTSPVLAAAKKIIEVSGGVKIFVDDVRLNPTDAYGNPIDVFIYNGTTYLPVRAVSEALGKPVQWEGSTQSVYIGKHTSSTPAAWLAEMDYYYTEDNGRWVFDESRQDNLGNEHRHSLGRVGLGVGSVAYKLNGQYSRLTAVYFLNYGSRSYDSDYELVISGDGQELWSGTVSAGVDPISIDIDLTGVLELKIENLVSSTSLGDIALWT